MSSTPHIPNDFNYKRRPLLSLLFALTAAVLLALIASLVSCTTATPSESHYIYVESIEQIQPRNIHEEMNVPIHRIIWSDSTTSTINGATRTPVIGDSALVITYKITNK